MIARPLDLASRLRRAPRSFDWLFFVNAGLLVLFFFFFGSRFVLSPGLSIGFELPRTAGARAGAQMTTHVITVVNAGQIFVGDGLRNMDQLQAWLQAEAKAEREPALLVRASAGVPAAILAKIVGLASSAGFRVMIAAEEPVAGAAGENPEAAP